MPPFNVREPVASCPWKKPSVALARGCGQQTTHLGTTRKRRRVSGLAAAAFRGGTTDPRAVHVAVLLVLLVGAGMFASSAALRGEELSADYANWPAYRQTPLGQIRPGKWRADADVIDGWDWSLPPRVEPADSGLVAVKRSFDLHKSMHGFLTPLNLPINPTVALWIRWRQLEPEEGHYAFDLLRLRVEEAESLGYAVTVRLLCSAREFAPEWLANHTIPIRSEREGTRPRVTNYDISHPEYHCRYRRLVERFGDSGIPRMAALRAAYVGYASPSFGDEGIGPEGVDPDTVPHVVERLDTWAKAFRGVEHKVFMGGDSDHGYKLGFGIRRGFVEMYLYHIPDPMIGQQLDEDGYLVVDEAALVLRDGRFHGEENEEYERYWATPAYECRFGRTTDSFSYRYFTANLRMLQMRCNYALFNEFSLIPEQFVWVGQSLGRTINDTPDVWCALRESYLAGYLREAIDGSETKPQQAWRHPLPVKNFERWLYQRDDKTHATQPAVRLPHACRMWMVHQGMDYDCVARVGKKIGFDVDDRWCGGQADCVAVKVTYFNDHADRLAVRLAAANGWAAQSLETDGTGGIRTATFFFQHAVFDRDQPYDIVLECPTGRTPVAFVRVVNVSDR